MTIPSKIDRINAEVDQIKTPPGHGEIIRMVPADIAEELARALFNLCMGIEQDGELPYDAAQSALARYRNAIDAHASSV